MGLGSEQFTDKKLAILRELNTRRAELDSSKLSILDELNRRAGINIEPVIPEGPAGTLPVNDGKPSESAQAPGPSPELGFLDFPLSPAAGGGMSLRQIMQAAEPALAGIAAVDDIIQERIGDISEPIRKFKESGDTSLDGFSKAIGKSILNYLKGDLGAAVKDAAEKTFTPGTLFGKITAREVDPEKQMKSYAEFMEEMGVPEGRTVTIPGTDKQVNSRDVLGFLFDIKSPALTEVFAPLKHIKSVKPKNQVKLIEKVINDQKLENVLGKEISKGGKDLTNRAAELGKQIEARELGREVTPESFSKSPIQAEALKKELTREEAIKKAEQNLINEIQFGDKNADEILAKQVDQYGFNEDELAKLYDRLFPGGKPSEMFAPVAEDVGPLSGLTSKEGKDVSETVLALEKQLRDRAAKQEVGAIEKELGRQAKTKAEKQQRKSVAQGQKLKEELEVEESGKMFKDIPETQTVESIDKANRSKGGKPISDRANAIKRQLDELDAEEARLKQQRKSSAQGEKHRAALRLKEIAQERRRLRAGEPAAKKPWQKTQDEYIGPASDIDEITELRKAHQNIVERAVKRGEDVPEEVLRKYRGQKWAKEALEAGKKKARGRPKPTPIEGEKPQERIDLGVQAEVPKGKIKTEPPKKEGLFAPEEPKGKQLSFEERAKAFDDAVQKRIDELQEGRKKKGGRPKKKVSEGAIDDPRDVIISRGIRLRRIDKNQKTGKLTEEMKALRSKFGPRIFRKQGGESTTSTIDEWAQELGISEDELVQGLIHDYATPKQREANLKDALDFFEQKAKDLGDDISKKGSGELPGFAGVVFGFQQDEEGNLAFDPTTAVLGAAAGVGAFKKFGKKKAADLIKAIENAKKNNVIVTGKGKAININLKNIGTTDDIKAVIALTAEAHKPLINSARRGKIAHEATEALADYTGITTEKLLKRRKGEAFNPEEAVAARQILDAHSERVHRLAEKAAQGNIDDIGKFLEAMELQKAIQAQVSGVAAEAGRTLSSFRIFAKGENAVARARTRNLERVMEALGGKEPTERIAQQLAKIDPLDSRDINRFIADIARATPGEKLKEYWYNAILSAPSTHFINIIGNTMTAALRPLERVTAASIDLVRAGVTGTKRQIFFKEAARDVAAMVGAIPEGFRAGIKAFKEEAPVFGSFSKLEEHTGRRAIKGTKGRIIRTPGRLLMASDEFFKAINFSGQKYSIAIRRALSQNSKLRGSALEKKMAELIQTDDSIIKTAEAEAFKRTFQNELGNVGKKISQLRIADKSKKGFEGAASRGTAGAMTFVIPFVRTPLNLLKFGIERSPLGFLKSAFFAKEYRDTVKAVAKLGDDLKAGKLTQKQYDAVVKKKKINGLTIEEFEEQLALPIVGSVIAGTAMFYAANKNIVGGGPTDPDKKRAWLAQGNKPYSMKIGDTVIQYGRLDPVAVTVGLAADLQELSNEGIELEEGMEILVQAIANNMTNKTYLQGITDAVEAFTDPTRKGASFINGFAASFIPNIVARVAQTEDPTLYTARETESALGRRLPSVIRDRLNLDVKPIRDIWGRPVLSVETKTERFLTPVRRGKMIKDKATDEAVRLELNFDAPRKSFGEIKRLGKKLELNDEQYALYAEYSGFAAWKDVSQLVENEKRYDRFNDEKKREKISEERSDARGKVRRIMKAGLVRGESIEEIKRRLENRFGKIKFNID